MNRRDLIVYISAKNCNPNGDINQDNAPRTDLQTGKGLMSSVSNKRRIKSAVQQMYDVPMLVDPSLVSIETRAKEALADLDEQALLQLPALDQDKAIKQAICKKYWDVRTFGAAIANLSKKDKTLKSDGQITGMAQVTWAESLDPIAVDQPATITRCNAATDADLAKGKTHDIGTTWIVPYAQYVYEVHVSGAKASWTGFDDNDYAMLLEGIKKSWLLNQSSSKAGMEVDCVIEFIHDSEFGSASLSALRDCIVLTPQTDSTGRVHYEISVDKSKVPSGVSCNMYR